MLLKDVSSGTAFRLGVFLYIKGRDEEVNYRDQQYCFQVGQFDGTGHELIWYEILPKPSRAKWLAISSEVQLGEVKSVVRWTPHAPKRNGGDLISY